jgi:hypothetical protein
MPEGLPAEVFRLAGGYDSEPVIDAALSEEWITTLNSTKHRIPPRPAE